MFFLNAETIRRLDRKTIDGGVPGAVLMERAGYGAFQFLTMIAAPSAERLLIVAGKGNNAGDAFVVARYLLHEGRQTDLLLLSDPNDFAGEARYNWERLQELQPAYTIAETPESVEAYMALWRGDVIIDGILGTGIAGEVREPFATAIAAVNRHPARVYALDIPSGLSCDTGTPSGCAIEATWTVTFAHGKRGILTATGADYCGRVEVVDIGISQELSIVVAEEREEAELTGCLTAGEARALLPARNIRAYKNTFGHLLVIAGSRTMSGAAVLCAQTALRSGAGLVTLAVPASLQALAAVQIPSVMTLPVPDDGTGMFLPGGLSILKKYLERSTALVFGPGIGTERATRRFTAELLAEIMVPAVIDADGLNIIAEENLLETLSGKPYILTPHPGEFSRLTRGARPGTATRERLTAAKEFADGNRLTIVLKGHQSVIASPGERPWINVSGNAGMATAGSGDVLAGIIGALLAQGIQPQAAAISGTYLHGLAGDITAAEKGVPGMISSDIPDRIGAALAYIDSLQVQQAEHTGQKHSDDMATEKV